MEFEMDERGNPYIFPQNRRLVNVQPSRLKTVPKASCGF